MENGAVTRMASSFVIRIGGLAISPARRDYFTASDGYGSDGSRASSALAEMLKGLGGCLGNRRIVAFGSLAKMFHGAGHVSLRGQNRCQIQVGPAEAGR